MVRFSDIITERDKKELTEDSPKARDEHQDSGLSNSQIARVLSDTQILKVRGERSPLAPSNQGQWSQEVVDHYGRFISRALEIRDRVKNDQGISPSPLLSDLHDILNEDLVCRLYEYAMLAQTETEWIIAHDVHVTFIALIVAREMGYDEKMLLKLGLAALLENVGMHKIPQGILEKNAPLDDKEMAMVREHPKTSHEILAGLGERYQWLAEVALQVHERTDGSGYPYGLRGGEIYELSSIIGLIDVYVAMVSKRPFREKLVQTDAIKYIVQEGGGHFPARIRKIFLSQISLFPVGTLVRLNNESVGRVLSTHKDQPLRPTMELLFDGTGKRVESPEVIHLSENPLIYITESLHERDLS